QRPVPRRVGERRGGGPGPGGPRLRGPLGLPRRLPGRALLRDERGGNCAVVPGGRRAAGHHRGPGAARGAPGLPAARLRRVRPVAGAGEPAQGGPGEGGARGRPGHALKLGRDPGESDCDVPVGRFRWLPTRQPVALDLWDNPHGTGEAYTTITTWHNKG